MPRLTKLVVATFNQNKVAEIRSWFAGYSLEIIALSRFTELAPAEKGSTFAENALAKARYGYQVSGLPTLADDSGLEVDALAGAPGVYSARYAGPGASDADNNRKLLQALGDVTADRRTARFRCAMALVWGDDSLVCQGTCPGFILESPRGSGGFGYDPLFWLPQRQATMAELSRDEKNRISHRGQALANLVAELKRRGWLG